MSTALTVRPAPTEYPPYYARYIEPLPDEPILDLLSEQVEEASALLEGIGEAGAGYRYAPGKWSVKEVAGHVVDVERIFCVRALRFARGDTAPLPGFEQNAYVATAGFDRLPLAVLVDALRVARAATLSFFRCLDDEALMRRGTAAGGEFVVRSVAWIIAGHTAHHLRLLEERYLPGIRG
ncbi:MAG: DinB family protein [Gemmatimonadota bacterium]|jgi:hypothetical protein